MRAPSSVPMPLTSSAPSTEAMDTITALAGPGLGDVERVIRECARVPDVPALEQVLLDVLTSPAKRLRPALALLVAQVVGGHHEAVVNLAAATEILHSATLVHDDIVDGAAERRGQPALHVTWSQKIAVLAGDYLFATSADLVARLDRPAIVRLFSATIHDMARSEFVTPEFDDDGDIAHRQYLQKIGHKTASLFAHTCEAVAVLADAPAEEREALRGLGWGVGMAFQITDDILDIRGAMVETGKPVGTDLRAGVLTLPVILYLGNDPSDGELVQDVLSGKSTDELAVARALDAINASGAVDEAAEVARGHANGARAALSVVRAVPARDSIEAFVQHTADRTR